MIRVLYFARYREMLGAEFEELPLPHDNFAVSDLKVYLAGRGEQWQVVFGADLKVLVAVNQEMATMDVTLVDGDEIAFFPPVTGG